MSEEQYNFVTNHFKKVYMGYLNDDINSMLNMELSPAQLESGSCAAPLAMLVFSSMNILGYLTSPQDTAAIENPREEPHTTVCIKDFCTHWMAKVDPIYGQPKIPDILLKLYRHSHAHQLLPEYGHAGITRNDADQAVLFNKVRLANHYLICLMNANVFAKDMQKTLPMIYAELRTDSDLLNRFYERLRRRFQGPPRIDLEDVEIPEREVLIVTGTTTTTTITDSSAVISYTSIPPSWAGESNS